MAARRFASVAFGSQGSITLELTKEYAALVYVEFLPAADKMLLLRRLAKDRDTDHRSALFFLISTVVRGVRAPFFGVAA